MIDCLVDYYVKVFEEAVHCSFEADRHISPETKATVTSTQGFPYLPWITIEREVLQHGVRKRATYCNLKTALWTLHFIANID